MGKEIEVFLYPAPAFFFFLFSCNKLACLLSFDLWFCSLDMLATINYKKCPFSPPSPSPPPSLLSFSPSFLPSFLISFSLSFLLSFSPSFSHSFFPSFFLSSSFFLSLSPPFSFFLPPFFSYSRLQCIIYKQ